MLTNEQTNKTKELVQAQINSLSREPFRELLAELLSCRPTVDALQTFANKSPDRYWQAVTQAGKLSGYQEKQVIENNTYVLIAQMSDSQVQAEREKITKELQAIEHED